MIKNFLIIFMIYIIGSLLIAKPDNMEVLKQSIFSTKELLGESIKNIESKFKEIGPEKSIAGHTKDFFSEKKTSREDSFFKEDRF